MVRSLYARPSFLSKTSNCHLKSPMAELYGSTFGRQRIPQNGNIFFPEEIFIWSHGQFPTAFFSFF